MAQSEAYLPTTRQVEVPLIAVETPAVLLPAPTEEQARAFDQVFAAPPTEERDVIVDAVNLAAAGMLLHDIVTDTLAMPANEEEEDEKEKAGKPQGKPMPEPL